MKKQMFSVAWVIVFLIAAVDVTAQEQAPAPVFQEGDFWNFKSTETSFGGISRSSPVDGIYGLFYSQGKVRIFKLMGDQKQPAERSAMRPILALLGQGLYQDLKFPLFVGEKWSYQYELTAIGAKRPLNHTVEISVTGVEQVTTPAGDFKAFKLQKEDAVRLGEYPWVSTYFYSPETKSVVKSFFDSAASGAGIKIEIELIKFGSAH